MSYAKWCLVLAAGTLSGASPSGLDRIQEHWRWSHFDHQSTGLPSERIQQILRAEDGTIWVATAGGVAWYDGYFWQSAAGLGRRSGIRLFMGPGSAVFAFQDSCLFEGGRSGFNPVPGCRSSTWQEAVPLDTGQILVASPLGEPAVFSTGQGQPAGFTDGLAQIRTTFFLQTNGRAAWWADPRGLYRTQRGSNRLIFASPTGEPWSTIGFHLSGLAENAAGLGIAAVVHPPAFTGLWEWDPGKEPRRVSAAAGLEDVRAIDVNEAGEVLLVHRSGRVWIRRLGEQWAELTPLPRPFEQVTHALFGGETICGWPPKPASFFTGARNPDGRFGRIPFRTTATRLTDWRPRATARFGSQTA